MEDTVQAAPPPAADSLAPSLKRRALRAGGWTLGGHVVIQALRLGGNLVMTRLLVPEMFGVMAIAFVFMTGLTLFSDMGIGQNIVQSRRGDDPDFLGTAWAVQILRGALIFVLALLMSLGLHLGAGWGWLVAGTVYADPRLPPVLAVLSLGALISGFDSNRLSLARRRLDLGRITRIEMSCPLVSLVVMVAWAAVDRSIWALVAGGLAGALTRTAMSHLLPGPDDRWCWDAAALDEILGFGKWIFLSSVLGFLLMNGDRLLLGGLVPARVLGLYSVAYMMVNAFQQALGKVVSGVALPAFSEVARNDLARLRRVYYRLRLPLDAAVLFAVGSLYATGRAVVGLLYDARYQDAGDMMSILALALAATRFELAEQCYLALGRPRLMTLQIAVRLVSLYLLVPLGFHLHGLTGALWGIVLCQYAVAPFALVIKRSLGLLDVGKELLTLPLLPLGYLLGKLAILAFWGRWDY